MRRARPSSARSKRPSAASGSTPICKGWFDRHAFQPVTSAMFLADMRAESGQGRQGAGSRSCSSTTGSIKPGIPANSRRPDPAAFADGRPGGRRLHQRRHAADAAPGRGWTTDERLRFLNSCRASCRRRGSTALEQALRPQRRRQQRSALRLARSGRRQPLRPGRARAGAVPDHSGPAQVRQAADHRARRGHSNGAGRSRRGSMPRRRPSYHPMTTARPRQAGTLTARRRIEPLALTAN